MRFGELGLLLQRGVEAGKRFLAAFKRVQDHALVDQDLRRGFSQAHRLGNETQCFGRLAAGETYQAALAKPATANLNPKLRFMALSLRYSADS